MVAHTVPCAKEDSRRVCENPTVVNRLLLGLVVVVIGAPVAHAQSVYINGGMGLTWRETGFRPRTPADVKPGPEPVTTLLLGGGWWLKETVALDGSIGFLRRQSLSWQYSYFANRHISTTDRDMPVLALIRIRATRLQRISIEPVLGAGITRHVAQSFVLAECGVFEPTTCTPVSPPRPSPENATWEWTASAGVDVPVWLSAHVALTPTARLSYVRRRHSLTRSRHI